MEAAEDAPVRAIDAIRAATEAPNANAPRLDEARQPHRRGQMRWGFAAENSMGSHIPEGALRTLGGDTDLTRQAQLKTALAGGN